MAIANDPKMIVLKVFDMNRRFYVEERIVNIGSKTIAKEKFVRFFGDIDFGYIFIPSLKLRE